MNTEEVAKKVVELTRKQAWKEALESLYAKDIVSVESRPNEDRFAGNTRHRRRSRQGGLVAGRHGNTQRESSRPVRGA